MMWDPGYGYGYGGIGSWFGMGFMMLFGLLFVVGVVLLIIWLARSAGGPGGAGGGYGGYRSGTESACDIAKMRFARGEITKEQYDEICRAVGG